MQSGDERRVAPSAEQDLSGHIGDGRVRQRRSEHVRYPVFEERDIDQFTGQRGFVWTEFEERIVRYGHLVVEDVLGKMFQSHRLAVGDEMHLMPFLGQGLPNSVATTPLPPNVG